jgi:hypothetical protein
VIGWELDCDALEAQGEAANAGGADRPWPWPAPRCSPGSHAPADDKPAPARPIVQAPPARPCWAWCGHAGPAPRCHPGSRYGSAPTFPCLVCGREIYPCQGNVLLCRDDCAPFVRDLEDAGPAAAAAAWLTSTEREDWEERAAILQDSGIKRDVADRRALFLVWRARWRQVSLEPDPSPPAEQLALDLGRGAW